MLEARALVPIPIDRAAALRAHRPGAADGEACHDDRGQKRIPAGAGGAIGAIAFRLFEGVVDRDRKGRMNLFGQPVHRLRHAVEKENLRLLLAAVAVGRGDQLLGLGRGERNE